MVGRIVIILVYGSITGTKIHTGIDMKQGYVEDKSDKALGYEITKALGCYLRMWISCFVNYFRNCKKKMTDPGQLSVN